jgi:hypothetical protein
MDQPAQNEPTPRFRAEAAFERAYPDASALATECVLNLAFVADRQRAYV